jgi:glycine/D-amino acid oxidase-like deaminating enzyme
MDAVVIGAGIVGLSAARELAQHGARVVVVE